MLKHNVNGNIEGVRDAMLARLDSLYSYELEEDEFLPRELMKLLAECSCALNREIAVYITRDGEIVNVAIGTDCDVELTDFRLRRNTSRLSCVRCVHTHPDGDGRLSDVDLSALKIFRYDAMTAVGVKDDEPVTVQTAFLGENAEVLLAPPARWYKLPEKEWLNQILESDRLVGREETEENEDGREKAVLMGIESKESLEELARLAETAGAEIVGSFLQKREKPDSAMFIGTLLDFGYTTRGLPKELRPYLHYPLLIHATGSSDYYERYRQYLEAKGDTTTLPPYGGVIVTLLDAAPEDTWSRTPSVLDLGAPCFDLEGYHLQVTDLSGEKQTRWIRWREKPAR